MLESMSDYFSLGVVVFFVLIYLLKRSDDKQRKETDKFMKNAPEE